MPAYLPPEHTALALRAGEMVQHISVKEKQPPLAQLTHVNTCLPTEGIWRNCRYNLLEEAHHRVPAPPVAGSLGSGLVVTDGISSFPVLAAAPAAYYCASLPQWDLTPLEP